MRAFALALLAATACPSLTGPALAQAEYKGMSPQYGTPPRPDYFDEPNYRPPGKEPNRHEFMVDVDANEYRREEPRPRPPRPGPRPPHHWPDHRPDRPDHHGPDRPHRR